jgi:alanyl-tRNA synthetase
MNKIACARLLKKIKVFKKTEEEARLLLNKSNQLASNIENGKLKASDISDMLCQFDRTINNWKKVLTELSIFLKKYPEQKDEMKLLTFTASALSFQLSIVRQRVKEIFNTQFGSLPEQKKQQIISELVLLGYTEKKAKDALQYVEQTMKDKCAPNEEWLKKALQILEGLSITKAA